MLQLQSHKVRLKELQEQGWTVIAGVDMDGNVTSVKLEKGLVQFKCKRETELSALLEMLEPFDISIYKKREV